MGLLTCGVKGSGARSRDGEGGMAIITALLATTILLALGMAIVFSATMDTVTTKTARLSEQAFFAADAGIGIARRALAKSFEARLDKLKKDLKSGAAVPYLNPARDTANPHVFPNVQLLPDPDTTDGQSCAFYQDVINNAVTLCSDATRNSRLNTLNGTSFTASFSPLSGKLSLIRNDLDATQSMVFRYTITVSGKTDAGGTATVSETGRLSTTITMTQGSVSSTSRSFAFSGFGAFFDNGDTQASAPLASGTFSGPVHTNTHFAFLSSRSVTFRNVVSQVDDKIRYDDTGSTTPNHVIPTADITGIDINVAEGYKQTAEVPLPRNVFSQEYSVINATGITDLKSDGTPVDPPAGVVSPVFDSSGRVTAAALAANLRGTSGTAPTISSGKIANGVYISSTDGTSISSTGAGIYVQGNADDIQLIGDTNGDQVYKIKQGTTTTTIRTSYTNNTTSISNGTTTRTLTGVFKDKADPNQTKNGAMLFVNGAISSLRGGKDTSATNPAVSASTRLTVTGMSDITITGDLKYANPVVATDGTPVTGIGSITNVLGIFTNDGNVNLAPNASYINTTSPNLSLEMNAAVVSFNADTSNDGGAIKGSIVYTGSPTPGTNDRWRLVGSRVQSKINSIGYTYRDIFFDTRFSGGTFAPPFFPGTTYALAPILTATGPVLIDQVATPAATAMSWFRNNK